MLGDTRDQAGGVELVIFCCFESPPPSVFPPFLVFLLRWRGTAQEKSRSKKCLFYITSLLSGHFSIWGKKKKIRRHIRFFYPENDGSSSPSEGGPKVRAHLKIWKGKRGGEEFEKSRCILFLFFARLFASPFSWSLDFPEICSAN